MAIYRKIQECGKSRYGFYPKTCWIADVKELEGLMVSHAWNRAGNERQMPCPPGKERAIRDALRHFGII